MSTCRHIYAPTHYRGEQFPRCRDCNAYVAPSGADGGSWVAVTLDYGTTRTWKDGRLVSETRDFDALWPNTRQELEGAK